MEKRGRISNSRSSQVTAFIIIGLIIIFVFALTMVLRNILLPDEDQFIAANLEDQKKIDAVNIYIKSCIRSSSIGPIRQISKNGGLLELEDNFRWYNESRFRYICFNEDSNALGCTNNLTGFEEMERILEKKILSETDNCIDRMLLGSQGYDASFSDMDVSVNIGLEAVEVNLHFPFTLRMEGTELVFEDFREEIKSPLGILVKTTADILNNYNNDKIIHYDQDKLDIDKINVEVHKPYPDTILEISKDNHSFRTAVKGISRFSSDIAVQEDIGCCQLKNNLCIKSMTADECSKRHGLFTPGEKCRCSDEPINQAGCCMRKDNTCFISGNSSCLISNFDNIFSPDATCSDLECTNMFCYYKNEIKMNGESWCAYEGPTGKGLDLIGSRHVKMTCLKGEIHVEECRDYRDELCYEEEIITEYGSQITNAMCRKNRWESCGDCKTKACCEDTDQRDCFWFDDDDQASCLPFVPPGFRTWESEGFLECAESNSETSCEGFDCISSWVNYSQRKCYMTGDCGNYLNIEYNNNNNGFLIMGDKTSRSFYEPQWNSKKVTWGFNEESNRPIESTVRYTSPTFSALLSQSLVILDKLSEYDINDYLNPNYTINDSISSIGICLPSDITLARYNCFECFDGVFPCTEYKCRTIGENCEYKETKGVPQCYYHEKQDYAPPVIGIKELNHSFRSLTDSNNSTGIEITEKLTPDKRISIIFNTSEDAKCRISFLPDNAYESLAAISFRNSSMSKEHQLDLFVSDLDSLFDKFITNFGAESSSDMIALLIEFKTKLEYLQYRHPAVKRFSQGYYPVIQPIVDKYLNKEIEDQIIQLIEDQARSRYTIYVKCQDKSGNNNKDDFYVTFNLGQKTIDNKEPSIIDTIPNNNSNITRGNTTYLYVYTNEWSECRYSEEDYEYYFMNSMSCPASRYETSHMYNISYLCRSIINISDKNKINIRCLDNPKNTMTFDLIGIRDEGNRTYPSDAIDLSKYELCYRINKEMKTKKAVDLSGHKLNKTANNTNSTTNRSTGKKSIELEDLKGYDELFCYEKKEDTNINNNSHTIFFRQSKMIEIESIEPQGILSSDVTKIRVITNKGLKETECSYTDNSSYAYYKLPVIDNRSYGIDISNLVPGEYGYIIRCSDKYGNTVEELASFKKPDE